MIGDSPANQVWWHMMTPEGSLKSMQEVYGATLPTAISDDPPNGNHWKYGVDWFRSDMRNKIMWKVLVTCEFRRFPVESHLDSRKRFCLQNSTLQNCIELSVASRENNQNSSWPNHHTLGLNIHSARRWCKFDHRRRCGEGWAMQHSCRILGHPVPMGLLKIEHNFSKHTHDSATAWSALLSFHQTKFQKPGKNMVQ